MSEASALNAVQHNEELDDLRAVMALPRGRRLMWRLIGHCQIFQEPGPASGDVHNYRSGMRGVGLFVYNELKEAAPDDFRRMEYENTTLRAATLEQEAATVRASEPEDIFSDD